MPGISSEPKFLTVKLKWWRPLLVSIFQHKAVYEYARRTREWCVCIVRVDMVAPSVARISTECGERIRKADARVCVCALSRPRLAELSTPPLSLPPTPFPTMHTCMWDVPAMYGWAAVRAVCRRGLAMIDCSEGIRNMKARILHACAMRALHDVAFMFEIRSEIQRLWAVKSLGQSRSAWYIFRQKAVWVTSENGDGRAEKPRYV